MASARPHKQAPAKTTHTGTFRPGIFYRAEKIGLSYQLGLSCQPGLSCQVRVSRHKPYLSWLASDIISFSASESTSS